MLGGPLEWASMLIAVATRFAKSDEDREELKDAKHALNVLGFVSGDRESNSVQRSAARTLISPMVLFEDSLMHQDYMVDLMTIINLRDIRDALTHLSLEGTVGSVKVANLIDKINPNRASGFNALIGCEAYNNESGSLFDKAVKNVERKRENAQKEKESERLTVDTNDMKDAKEYVPLALGRIVKASSMIDGKEVSFILTFRQIPIPAPSKEIERMFMGAKKGEDWKVRIKDYKAGGITRPELLKGTDVIKREFSIRNNDLSGYYREASKREILNARKAITSGYSSMNDLANTIIISKDTADNIELELGMRFNSPKIKVIRRYMNANTIVVVNDERAVVEFFTIGDSIPVKYTFQQIKTKSNKEDAGSLEAIVKLLNGR